MNLISRLISIGFTPTQAKHLGIAVANNLTATGSTSQANAYRITEAVSIFETVTPTNNSCMLPKAASCPVGRLLVKNMTAEPLEVFPYFGDKFLTLPIDANATVDRFQIVEFILIGEKVWMPL